MTDRLLNDSTLRTARAALDGLAVQQELIGLNLSNVDTPAYRAQEADFSTALKRALDREQAGVFRLQTTRSGHMAAVSSPDGIQVSLRKGGSLRADGNNVDVDTELTQLSEVGVEYQALTQLVSKKLLLLKNIATGR